MSETYFLAIDIGTGSVRAALVAARGEMLHFSQRTHRTHMPKPGWVEQDSAVWWRGVTATVRDVIRKSRIRPQLVKGICVCGQMHGPVPIDARGDVLLSRIQLWNDKRSEPICEELRQAGNENALLKITANPVASSWTGFKASWIKRHQRAVYRRARTFLTPKDFINFRLTNEIATDYSEASGSFLLNWKTLEYSPDMAQALDLNLDKFAPVYPPDKVIGKVSAKAARETGLAKDTPVVAGGGDFLVSLLGSGITKPGIGSDLTGTSTLISTYSKTPLLDRHVMNLHAAGRNWIPFTLVDAGGDAMRWARNTFAPEGAPFDTINRMAARSVPGAGGLLFLPYLTGERIGGRADSRAQFFGICASHKPYHFYRVVMEGTAFASRRNLETMRRLGSRFKEIVATGGGAKGRLWLRIKAAIYNLPIRAPANVESGVLGCAILAACGAGVFSSPEEGAQQLVKMKRTIQPDAEWVRTYRKLEPVFDRLYERSQDCFQILSDI